MLNDLALPWSCRARSSDHRDGQQPGMEPAVQSQDHLLGHRQPSTQAPQHSTTQAGQHRASGSYSLKMHIYRGISVFTLLFY